MTESTRLRNALKNAIIDDGIIEDRYMAIRFIYHWFRLSGLDSVPFWAFDIVDEMYYNGYLEN